MVRLSIAFSAASLLGIALAPAACSQDNTPGPGPAIQAPADTTPTDELRDLDLTGRNQAPPILEPDVDVAPEGQEELDLSNPFGFEGPMTPERMGELILLVDEDAQEMGNGYIFKVQDRDLRLVYDERADRMRIITPIIPAASLPDEILTRMLQANFDSVLDSRYAIGGGNVWSVFIHRMSSLTSEDLISGIAQTAVAAESFGTSFTSGAVVFGGGDSSEINRELLERLEEALRNQEEDRGI